jgi:hypothetical protein
VTTGAANMRALSRQLAAVPDGAVAELVAWFVPRSEQIGGRGRWFGRTVQLSSRIKRRARGQATNLVVVGGTPPALWSIKSYGRRGGYPVRAVRARSLHLGGFSPGQFFERVDVGAGTTGDRRWDRLVAEADDKFVTVAADVVSRRVVTF